MQDKQLFLIKIDQLKACVLQQGDADMLVIAQSLRQLLLDGDRLIHIINRRHRLHIRFEVGMSTIQREEEMRSLNLPIPYVHFLGAFPPNEPRQSVNVDDFLAFPVVKYCDEHFTVSSLIQCCCQRLGAVHFGYPATDTNSEAQIRSLGEILTNIGLKGAFSTLVIIASTVLNGLAPLYAAVQAE